MKIEEIIRSCGNERVAAAAVASMGRAFAHEIHDAAECYGMSVGGFTAFAIERFSRRGDEREMRSVASVMARAQEPVLAGLHRILCLTLASGGPSLRRQERTSAVQVPLVLCAMDTDARREQAY